MMKLNLRSKPKKSLALLVFVAIGVVGSITIIYAFKYLNGDQTSVDLRAVLGQKTENVGQAASIAYIDPSPAYHDALDQWRREIQATTNLDTLFKISDYFFFNSLVPSEFRDNHLVSLFDYQTIKNGSQNRDVEIVKSNLYQLSLVLLNSL